MKSDLYLHLSARVDSGESDTDLNRLTNISKVMHFLID